jgi:hypothetical protein
MGNLGATFLRWKSLALVLLACLFIGACGGSDGNGVVAQQPPSSSSYYVYGRVVGLEGSETVVLLNNGTASTTVIANTGNLFSFPLLSHEDYLITVQNQPAIKTCSVVNGVGKNVTSNVFDVIVNCSYITHTIGGTLTGLASDASVTLTNNGSDRIELKSNGVFHFPTPIAHGAGYFAFVESNTPGQTCIVNRYASGYPVIDDVSNIEVTCSDNFKQVPPTQAMPVAWVRRFESTGDPLLISTVTSIKLYDGQIEQYRQQTQKYLGFVLRNASRTEVTDLQMGSTPINGPVLGMTNQAMDSFYFNNSRGPHLDFDSCLTRNGAYYVSELVYDASGVLSKFAADFAGECVAGPSFRVGAIRYNSSVAVSLDKTFVSAGRDQVVTEGAPLALNGSISWNPSSRIKTFEWTQISGPAFDMSKCKVAICYTYAPLVAIGGATAEFLLTVKSESGKIGTSKIKIKVRSWQDQQSRFDNFGDGYVATTGRNVSLNEDNGYFTVIPLNAYGSIYPHQTKERIDIDYWGFTPFGGLIVPPNMVLSNKKNSDLVLGQYSGQLRADFEPLENVPSFTFSAGGAVCGQPDWNANLTALNRDSSDLTKISKLAVFFRVRCMEAGGEAGNTFGRFWINYRPFMPPVAKALAPVSVQAGATFVIVDAGSLTPAGYKWVTKIQQLAGEPIEDLTFTSDGRAIVKTSTSSLGGSTLVFAYEITDSLGQAGVSLVEVKIAGTAPALTVMKKTAESKKPSEKYLQNRSYTRMSR